jgi:hypothetical protein
MADWLDAPLRKLTRPMVRERHEAIGKKTLKGCRGLQLKLRIWGLHVRGAVPGAPMSSEA